MSRASSPGVASAFYFPPDPTSILGALQSLEDDRVRQGLQDCAAGRLILRGETLREWTTPKEVSRLRREAFGSDD
jgi:hypothetical protein